MLFLVRTEQGLFSFAFLGNDGILDLFALNAKILGAELDYCDLKRVS